jgi:hypothetical protein
MLLFAQFTLLITAITVTAESPEWIACGAEQERERSLYPGCVAERCGLFQNPAPLPGADYSRLRTEVNQLEEEHDGIFAAVDIIRKEQEFLKDFEQSSVK